jgi:hypothetical protein
MTEPGAALICRLNAAEWRLIIMIGPQNIQIPLSLFNKISTIFLFMDISEYILPDMLDFDGTLLAIRVKQDKINLRAAYTNIVIAQDDELKHRALYNYTRLKNKQNSS